MSTGRNIFDTVADIAIDYIERAADSKRGIRDDYCAAMSASGWRNRSFEEMIKLYVDQLPELMDEVDPDQRRSEEDIIISTIPGYIDGHTAMSIVKSPIADELDDRTFADMSRTAEKWEDLWTGRSRRSRGRDSGRQAGREQSRSVHRPVGGGSAYNNDRYGRGGHSRTGSFSRDELSSGAPSYGRSSSRGSSRDQPTGRRIGVWGAINDINETKGRQDNPYTEEEHQDMRREQAQPERTRPTACYEPARSEMASGAVEGYDYSKAKPHEDFYKNGEHWVFINAAPEELVKQAQVVSFFDVNESLLYLVKDSMNKVREELIEVNEDNRYLQQELMNTPQQRSRSNRVTLTGESEAEVETEYTPKQKARRLEDALSAVSVEELTSKNSTVLHASLKEATESALIRLTTSNKEVEAPQPCAIRDIVILMDNIDAEATLVQFEETRTLVQFHALLVETRGKIDNNLWTKINKRMSNLLTDSMRYQWRMPSKNPIDFHRDFIKMIEALKGKASNVEFVNLFISRTSALIEQALLRLDPSEVGSAIGDLRAADDDKHVNAVVFLDYEYVFAIRNTADELGIGKQLEDRRTGVAVREMDGEALPNALRSIYRHLPILNETKRTVQPVRIATSDYKVITVWPFNARLDEFIFSQPVDNI